jgi:hypothetical protein
MTPTLTLHQGEQHAEYVEHPIETARKALLAAAHAESGQLADHCRRFAATLPSRPPIAKRAGLDDVGSR